MLLYDKEGNKPVRGARGVDYDGEVLIAKCGEIKRHHWARKTKDPDTWHEPETDWHLDLKSYFPRTDTEQVVEVAGERHRMDARTCLDGCWYVVEFQNSPIEPKEVRQRDTVYPLAGYKGVIWLFNGAKLNLKVEECGSGLYRATIGASRYSIWQCNCAAMIDCGPVIYLVVATPEYKNDFWYLRACPREEMMKTLTSGIFTAFTADLATILAEGAA